MEDIKKFQEKVSKNEPSTPQEWQASNFSLQGYENKGNDHQLKKLLIFNPLTPKIWLSILPSSCYTFPC